ncbi:MAG: hypothetical protein IKC46_09595 [Lachnospiraceae bacterium]|nr:hypothetical protein [Lachnospiraceae bacterium]
MNASLLSALIGLARAADSNIPSETTDRTMLKGLLTLSDIPQDITVEKIHLEKYKLVPDCQYCASPCKRTSDPSPSDLDIDTPEIRHKKHQILNAALSIAPVVYCKYTDGKNCEALCLLLYRALFALGENWDESYFDSILEDLAKTSDIL